MAIRKMVLLVAGHGGGDPGATGQGSTEAQETIQLVNRVYNLLAPHPNIVVEHDPFELDYIASTKWINDNYKNLEDCIVVEIHKNSFSGPATGNEILVPGGADSVSKSIANKILNALTESTGLTNRGVKERSDLYLINTVNPYAVLVEAGFITYDPIDDAADEKFARGIANGLCDYFGESRPGSMPKPVVTTGEVTVKEVVAYATKTVSDSTMLADEKKTVQYGVNGSTTTTFTVTYTDGKETSRVVKAQQSVPPIDEIIHVGTMTKDAEQDARLSVIEAFIKKLTDFFSKIFKDFLK